MFLLLKVLCTLIATLSLLIAIALTPMALAQLPATAANIIPPEVEPGEIRLDGIVHAVDAGANTLILQVASFSLPNGKSSPLSPPKPKTILIDEQTLLHVRGAETKVALSSIKKGVAAIVIGRDVGTGRPLHARRIALWDHVTDGIFHLGEEKTAASRNERKDNASAPLVATPQDKPTEDALDVEYLATEITRAKAQNVFAPGDFEGVDEKVKPAGWNYAAGVNYKWVEEETGNHLMIITKQGGERGQKNISATLRLDPRWKTLNVIARMRVQKLVIGTEDWQNARLPFRFEDAKGKTLDYAALFFQHDTDWVARRKRIAVPAGAHHVDIDPGVYGPSGELSIDDLLIVPNPPAEVLEIREGFPEGKLETVGFNNDPVGWDLNDRKRIKWQEEEGNHFIRIISEEARNYVQAYGRFKLDPTWKTLVVKVRMRAFNLSIGAKPYQEARLWVTFEDANGKEVQPAPPSPSLKKETPDWVSLQVQTPVPPGAVYIRFSPATLATSGIVDFDDISIEQSNPALQTP